MNKGQLYISDFFTLLIFTNFEDLKRARFTDFADGGYRDIMTPNGPPGLYDKLQTERLSKELGSTVITIWRGVPMLFLDKIVENDKIYYHIITKGKIGWFKMKPEYNIIPLTKDTKEYRDV